MSGDVGVDGSSTVFPITEAVAEEFNKAEGDIRVTVAVSGTGGGFERFCAGETDVSNASRPIKDSEAEVCAAAGIDFVEIPVAFDALTVVVNPDNDFVTCMTIDELHTMWSPESEDTITRWSQVREGWPDEEFRLYGPGVDSGTFDYFTETVNDAAQASRGDFSPSEDDNVIVQGVAGDNNALGYFGLAYFLENQGTLKAVEIDGGEGCVAPSAEATEAGLYTPLARPLFIYVSVQSAERPEVEAFVDFYLQNAAELSADVGYVQFPADVYGLVTSRWDSRTTGSMYAGGISGGIVDLLSQQ